MATKITSRSQNYSQWYIDIVLGAKLADYSPVKGCMVIRPRGYAIWERLQAEFDRKFKETGHQNAYFPSLIPMSFLKKEAEHVKGFAPELAVVTHAGGEELEEPYCIRPTSETVIWSMYKNWIQSWRDLPLLYNQWCPVMRWEKRTRLFLRTSEFLWQEGHTAHETETEASDETLKMLQVYKSTCEDYMALPVIAGLKTDSEKFAGAVRTYSIEAMMQDKKALQAGTSHFLGQNFARAFDVQFQNREGKLEYVWATSWGVSTRLIGAIIMAHSDDRGLVLPPNLASEELVIIPITKAENRASVLAYAEKIFNRLKDAGLRVVLDADDENSPGWKFSEWELRGLPLRLEIGQRDMDGSMVTLCRRDLARGEEGEKTQIPFEGIEEKIKHCLSEIQKNLFNRALQNRKSNTKDVENIDELDNFFKGAKDGNDTFGGFGRGLWCGLANCEDKIKFEYKLTIRCLPLDDQENIVGNCCICGSKGVKRAIFARSY